LGPGQIPALVIWEWGGTREATAWLDGPGVVAGPESVATALAPG